MRQSNIFIGIMSRQIGAGIVPPNLLSDTQDFSLWGSSAGVTLASGTAPDGTNTLNLLEDDDVAAVLDRRVTTLIPADTSAYNSSVYFKAGTSLCFSVRIEYGEGATHAHELVVDPVGIQGQWRTDGATAGVSFEIEAAENDCYRVSLVTENNGTNVLIRTILRPAYALVYSPTLNIAAVGDTLFWGAQLTRGSALHAYQPA